MLETEKVIPEHIIRSKKRQEEFNKLINSKKEKFEKMKTAFNEKHKKRAEAFLNEYKREMQEKELLKKEAKEKGCFYVQETPKLAFVIRIKG